MIQIQAQPKESGLAKVAKVAALGGGLASGGVGAVAAGSSFLADRQAAKPQPVQQSGDAMQRHLDKLNALRYQGG
jgi:hypothetical protein